MNAVELRRRAEELLDDDLRSTWGSQDARRVIDEVCLHQLELQLQEVELQNTRCELENTRASYRALYDASPIAQLILDEGGRVLDANQAAARLLGTPPSAMIERPLAGWLD